MGGIGLLFSTDRTTFAGLQFEVTCPASVFPLSPPPELLPPPSVPPELLPLPSPPPELFPSEPPASLVAD